ncbi:hypothetical protein HKBW3S25_01932, partial [Candidatus Hakubella thermalkaliphila]
MANFYKEKYHTDFKDRLRNKVLEILNKDQGSDSYGLVDRYRVGRSTIMRPSFPIND